MKVRRQVQAAVKAAPTRGPKRRKVEDGGLSDSGDDGDIVASHLQRLGCRGEAVEGSIRRALIAIGVSEWSCVRRGQSRAGANRITVSLTLSEFCLGGQ